MAKIENVFGLWDIAPQISNISMIIFMETIFCLSAVRASIAQPFRRRDNLNGFFSPDIAKDVKEQSVHSREKRDNSLGLAQLDFIKQTS